VDTFPVPTFACLHCGRRMPLLYACAEGECPWCSGVGIDAPVVPEPGVRPALDFSDSHA
jgi:hypothetical protein